MTDNKFTVLRDEDQASDLGPLKVIRNYKTGGSILTYNNGEKSEEALPPGFAIEGIYEGRKVQLDKKGKERVEYMIRAEGNTLVLIKACSALNDAKTGLAAVREGELVQVTFLGMKVTKNGNDFARFQVATASEAAG